MFIHRMIPRRVTTRPVLIICVMVGTLLLSSPFRRENAGPTLMSSESKLPSMSRIYPRIPKAAPGIQFNELALPIAHERPGLLDAIHKEEQKHNYRNDGLLEVNAAGSHPIYELIKRAQKDWDRKLESASKTLDEAVDEYRRRYKRLPPKGFDDWWAYVQEKNVQLPDEYDQIYRDLEPFWGVHPRDVQTLQRDWEDHADTFTIGKDTYDDKFSLKNHSISDGDIGPTGHAKGAHELMDLLKDVADKLPPFRAVFWPGDNPNLHTDYAVKQKALQAARSQTYIDITDLPEHNFDGWTAACAPTSPAHIQAINWGHAPPARRTKTFIHDHRVSMDPCQHPTHFLLHGQFLSHHRGPLPQRLMVPQFSYSPTMLHHDITLAMPINWVEDLEQADNPVWAARPDARVQWRGSNTGMMHEEGNRWDLAQRTRLMRWAGERDQMMGLGNEEEEEEEEEEEDKEGVSVLMPAVEGRTVGRPVRVHRALWASAMADVAFAGKPLNCAPEMCAKLGKLFEFRKRHDGKTAGRYKYYIDVDGNGWSSRFKRLMTTNGLVFKSTIYPEWYTDRVASWVHYVPVQVDLSDLWDALTFFRGGPLEDGAHDEMARKIAEAGQEWSKTFWRKEDMVAYNFRLFLEYGRVMSLDREEMTFRRKTKRTGGR